MIERILGKFGYIQKFMLETRIEWEKNKAIGELTEDELALMLAFKLGTQDAIDPEYESKIFADLKGTDGLVQYLREAAARDKDRYFGCTTKEEQLIVRGAFARTMYLKAKISGADATE